MKYVSLIVLLSLTTSQVFALAEGVLEDSQQGVEIVSIQAPPPMQDERRDIRVNASLERYDDKPAHDPGQKIFVNKDSSANNLNLTSSKEEVNNNLDVYHVDVKKVGESFEKVEKLVEIDKNAQGEKIIKKVVKCGGGGTKHHSKCQTYNHDFCSAIILKENKIRDLNDETAQNEQNKINEIENLYQQHDVRSVKPEIVTKLVSFANDSKEKSGVNLSEEIKVKLNDRQSSHPMANDIKPRKFKEDLRECKDLISSFKPTSSTTPNNNERRVSANRQ
jgi:hypothetical protein